MGDAGAAAIAGALAGNAGTALRLLDLSRGGVGDGAAGALGRMLATDEHLVVLKLQVRGGRKREGAAPASSLLPPTEHRPPTGHTRPLRRSLPALLPRPAAPGTGESYWR